MLQAVGTVALGVILISVEFPILMSRSHIYPLLLRLLLLVMAMLVVGCQGQTSGEGHLPDSAATLTEAVSPLVLGEQGLDGRQRVTSMAPNATVKSVAVANPPLAVFDTPQKARKIAGAAWPNHPLEMRQFGLCLFDEFIYDGP